MFSIESIQNVTRKKTIDTRDSRDMLLKKRSMRAFNQTPGIVSHKQTSAAHCVRHLRVVVSVSVVPSSATMMGDLEHVVLLDALAVPLSYRTLLTCSCC